MPEMKFAVQEAKGIVEAVADVYHSHTREWFSGLIVLRFCCQGRLHPRM